MSARWMVDWQRAWTKAHLYNRQRPPLERYMAKACEFVGVPLGVLLPDDGRPRCKRCLAAERKAKEATR